MQDLTWWVEYDTPSISKAVHVGSGDEYLSQGTRVG